MEPKGRAMLPSRIVGGMEAEGGNRQPVPKRKQGGQLVIGILIGVRHRPFGLANSLEQYWNF
jgi:hypothetical protein